MVISRKNYERVVNLLYLKNQYPQITSIPCFFSDIKNTKQKYLASMPRLHFIEKILGRHKELWTRNNFMSVLYVLSVPVSKQAQIKFHQYKYCTKASFVICADF